MIASKFIYNILDLLLDGEPDVLPIRNQLPYLTETNYNYTGMGLFVHFDKADRILKCADTIDSRILSGVTISSSSLELGAEALLFFKNGLINYLEIYSYSGEYPQYELTDYILTQAWNDSPGKQIFVGNEPI